MLFQQWSLEFWLHIPWTMSFLMMTVTFGAKENWCKIQQRTLINTGPRADFICCYATDCVTYILCGKASFVFLLFPPPSCKQAIIAKHSPKFSWLRNAGLLLYKAWTHHYSTADMLCFLIANSCLFLCFPCVWQSVASLSAWTAEKSSTETHQYSSRCGTAVDKEEVLIRYYFQPRGFG